MAYEVNLGQRTAKVDVLNRNGNKVLLDIDGHKYDVDIAMVEQGVYSILYNGHSYNVELIQSDNSKKYIVNTFAKTFNVEVVDAESKYISSRSQGMQQEEENLVASPMPGKVVKIPVKAGDQVIAGQTLIVVEAMKMQSEFKASHDKTVLEVLVKEGDTVNAHQLMMKLE
jgi:biotin carboxyl carrier protein